MTYPPSVRERAMKIQEVLTRAMSGQISWVKAAWGHRISPSSRRAFREEPLPGAARSRVGATHEPSLGWKVPRLIIARWWRRLRNPWRLEFGRERPRVVVIWKSVVLNDLLELFPCSRN